MPQILLFVSFCLEILILVLLILTIIIFFSFHFELTDDYTTKKTLTLTYIFSLEVFNQAMEKKT